MGLKKSVSLDKPQNRQKNFEIWVTVLNLHKWKIGKSWLRGKHENDNERKWTIIWAKINNKIKVFLGMSSNCKLK